MSTTSRIEALQRERDSFVSHEQRIIRGTKKIIYSNIIFTDGNDWVF